MKNKLTTKEVLRWSNKHRKLEGEGARVVHVRQLLERQKKEIIEKLEKMIDPKAFGGILNRRNEIIRQAKQTIKNDK